MSTQQRLEHELAFRCAQSKPVKADVRLMKNIIKILFIITIITVTTSAQDINGT